MTDASAPAEAASDELPVTPAAEVPVEPPVDTETPVEGDEPDGEIDDLQDDKPRGKTAKDRIADLTRARREAERSAEYWKGIATQTAQPSGDLPALEPVADDFDTYDDFLKALAAHTVKVTLQESHATSVKTSEQNFRVESWKAKVDAFSAITPDYDAVLEAAPNIDLGKHVIEALMDSDKGPELAYYMAQRPDVINRLNGMSPVKAAIEMGRLETQLAAPVVKPASRAPAPVTPARGGSSASVNLAKADMDDYIAARRKMGARF